MLVCLLPDVLLPLATCNSPQKEQTMANSSCRSLFFPLRPLPLPLLQGIKRW